MDREEYPAMTGPGDVTPSTCIREAPPVEPALSDTYQPYCSADEDQFCTPLTVLPQTQNAGRARRAAEDSSLAHVLEALLFSSDTPLSASRLAELAGVGSLTEVRLALAELNDKYAAAGLSFRIEEIARGYQMLTQPQYQPWLARLNKQQAQTRLSAAALETLSIVAYKQPVIRADIEAIRGVACGEVLNRLREMGLVRIIGRAEIIGRPLLYGTTRRFLEVFGLADLEDLPPLETLTLRQPTSAVAAAPTERSDEGARQGPRAAAGA